MLEMRHWTDRWHVSAIFINAVQFCQLIINQEAGGYQLTSVNTEPWHRLLEKYTKRCWTFVQVVCRGLCVSVCVASLSRRIFALRLLVPIIKLINFSLGTVLRDLRQYKFSVQKLVVLAFDSYTWRDLRCSLMIKWPRGNCLLCPCSFPHSVVILFWVSVSHFWKLLQDWAVAMDVDVIYATLFWFLSTQHTSVDLFFFYHFLNFPTSLRIKQELSQELCIIEVAMLSTTPACHSIYKQSIFSITVL